MLGGKRILITSGPTRMPLDSVRYLTNASTGYFGTLLARQAIKQKVHVTFVYGKGSLTPAPSKFLKLVPVETNLEVAKVLQSQLQHFQYDAVIHAMAILDFQPLHIGKGKVKTNQKRWRITFVPTPKIILSIKKWAPHVLLVGFKLEVGVTRRELIQRARRLFKKSRADLVLANQLVEGSDSKHPWILLDPNRGIIAEGRGKVKGTKAIIQEVMRRI